MTKEAQPKTTMLLRVDNLKTFFYTSQGTAKAVDEVSFTVQDGETLGIVGESGCGKTVTGLSILRLIPDPPGRIIDGKILFQGDDLLKYSEGRMSEIRGRKISMIFQEPMTSLNPVFSIGFQISEIFRLHMGSGKREAFERSIDILQKVHIPSPKKRIHEYPYELSGGMRQRVMIAMALCCNPCLIIADEPTTALDVTIQAQILELMEELKQKLDMAMILITHDLGIVAHTVQRILIMYAGKIVEEGGVDLIFEKPLHPYTRGLLKANPGVDRTPGNHAERLYEIKGVIPSLYRLPEGCNFYPRCEIREAKCRQQEPRMMAVGEKHHVCCWKAG